MTQSSHTLGEIQIRIIQVKRRGHSPTPPSFCRAWVEISKGNALLKRLMYGDIEPVGGNYGVFTPPLQPNADYFVMVKEGDYDGHLLLVDREGKVTDTLGGAFFVGRQRYLFSNYSSDEAGLAVFDLQARKLLLRSTDIPYIGNWYRDDTGYYFLDAEDESIETRDGTVNVYRVDLTRGQVVKMPISIAKVKSSRVDYDFYPRTYADCTSK